MTIKTHSGRFNQRLAIRANDADRSANTDGQLPDDPTLITHRWAEIKPIRGTQRFIAQQNKEDITHLIRMRYDAVTKDITAKHWLTHEDGRRFDIKRSFDVEEGRREIEMECTQRR